MSEELQQKADALAGRPVEIVETADGQWIALYMRFDSAPPPKAETPEAALAAFVTYMEPLKKSDEKLEEGN